MLDEFRCYAVREKRQQGGEVEDGASEGAALLWLRDSLLIGREHRRLRGWFGRPGSNDAAHRGV